MPFDVKKLETKINEKKVDFIITLVLFIIIMAACVGVIVFLFYNTVALIVGIVSFLWLGYKLGKLWAAAEPKILFSKGYTGTVISIAKAPKTEKQRGGILSQKSKSATGEMKIRLDSGEIISLTALRTDALDEYKCGDTVCALAGAKYPIVTGRAPSYTPCPLCGTVRRRGEPTCRNSACKAQRP